MEKIAKLHRQVRRSYFRHPALVIGKAVDQNRILRKGLVDLDDRSRNGGYRGDFLIPAGERDEPLPLSNALSGLREDKTLNGTDKPLGKIINPDGDDIGPACLGPTMPRMHIATHHLMREGHRDVPFFRNSHGFAYGVPIHLDTDE